MQDLVVRHLGMRHDKSSVADLLGGQDLLEASLREMPDFPAPSWIHWSGIYMNFWRRMAEKGLRTHLMGSGGDEWLSVHPAYAADLIRRLSLLRWTRLLIADAVTGGASLPHALRYLGWDFGLRPILGSIWQKYQPESKQRHNRRSLMSQFPSWLRLSTELSEQLQAQLLERRIPELDTHGCLPRYYYRHILRTSWDGNYLTYENETVFHTSSAAGLRLVSPFHDQDMVEFFCRVPPYMLYRGAKYKGLLRTLAKERLGGLNLEKQRKRYPAPQKSFLNRALRSSLGRLFMQTGCRRLADLGLLEPGRVREAIAHSESLSHKDRVKLYAMLSAEVWLKARET
jgi:hypothetical protein